MRTKLFLAFLLVIVTALISNLIFEWLIMKDFDEYAKGTKEDHLYWVLASVEGSYQNGKWDMRSLSDAVHWGMMLGFDIRVEDIEGRMLLDSHSVMDSLSPAMTRRMEPMINIHKAEGEFERYPLYMEGKELGALFVRPVQIKGDTGIKEMIFKKRGNYFLTVSFLIAGVGATLLAVYLALYLSRPIKRLKSAADGIAKGDFAIRVTPATGDEIGRLSESFNYMAEALQKEELLRRHLTSNIAHELRTPLAVMKAQAEAMIDGVIEDRSEGLENIRKEIEKLTRLVEGIEDLTKAEASFFTKGEYNTIDLKEFLQGIGSAIDPVFREKGLSFSIMDRGGVKVITDTDKLERVIRNILSNSIKYTEGGGVSIDYGKEGGDFFIKISDTGTGIPEDELQKIFKRFYRGSSATGSGIGVGLAIVKEIVDIMGGRIDVKSNVGEGTLFKVWLPSKAVHML